MRKNRAYTIILVLMFITLPIISILMVHHITLSETISCMDSGAFGSEYNLISVDENVLPEKVFSIINIQDRRAAIYSDYQMENGVTIRGICFNGRYVDFPMKWGRFFKESDFESSKLIAVVGKALESDIYIKGGNKCILVNGIEYSVIGILGYEEDTLFDSYIFINGKTVGEVYTGTIYTVDIFETQKGNSYITYIVDIMNNAGIETEILLTAEAFGEDFLPRILYSRMFIAIFVIDLLCIMLLSSQWINSQKKKFGIMRLIGISNKCLVWQLVKSYLVIVVLSFCIGALYCKIFYSEYMYIIFYGYAFFLPFAIVLMTVSAISILSEKIEETIK